MERKLFTVNYSGNNGGLSNGNTESKSGNGQLVFSSTYVNDKKVKLKSYKDMNTPKEDEEDVKKNVQFEAMYDAVLKYHTKDEKDELCIYFNPTLNKYKITVEDGYEMIFYNQNVNPEKVNEFDINPQTVVILHKTL